MHAKRRTRVISSPLVGRLQRPAAGCAGRVGVIPAVVIALVLASLLIGGLAVVDLTRDGSGSIELPFVDRGPHANNDESSGANDEPDENEAPEADTVGGEENEPAENEREPEQASGPDDDTSRAHDELDENEPREG